MTTTSLPNYLESSYEIQKGESRRAILDSLLSYYYCSWSILAENLDMPASTFLSKIDNCKTTGEIKKLVNSYI